jgi:hypothetical protein
MTKKTNPHADFIANIECLNKENHQEANSLLRRVAGLVKPIMKSKNWKVGKLSEFYPKDQSLLGLNINRGLEIKIRLRHPRNADVFLDFESIVGTMLHELTHIVRGPHDAQFYKILDGLTSELEGLMQKGWKGEGFDADGKRVGQGVSHNVDPREARIKALESAEKRRKLTHSGLGGGQRLGGSLDRDIERRMDPRDLAKMAAEKRAAKDRIWCGSDQQAKIPDSPIEIPDSPVHIRHSPVHTTESPAHTSDSYKKLDKEWECQVCTFFNVSTYLLCDACSTPRNQNFQSGKTQTLAEKVEEGWYCPKCIHHVADRFRICNKCKYLRQI